MTPERLDRGRESLKEFIERVRPARSVDNYRLLLEELFLVRNPRFKFKKPEQGEVDTFIDAHAPRGTDEAGEWFYFPWNGTLAHYLPSAEHLEVRTARNRNIITEDEQRKIYALRVAYAGLSVGSHGALTYALMGGGSRIAIADPDTISPSNLNRIRYDFLSVGRRKTDMVREHIAQLDPYADVRAYDGGVTLENIDTFLADADVLVEETDDLEMKIRLRLKARERGIPVIMATDNGHNVIIDVERFDFDRGLPLFNNAIGPVTLDEFRSFSPQELPRLATKIAGPGFVTERVMASLPEVGKTLYSWPQLGNAATLAGVSIAYLLCRIALGEPVREGKSEINLDAILDPEYASPERSKARDVARHSFLTALGLS